MRSRPVSAGPLTRRPRRDDVPLIALSVAGVTAVAVIGLLLFLHLRGAGFDHERREAERQTTLAAKAVVAPLITPALARGDPAALARLDRAVRRLLLRDPVARVKLWAADGRIVYSDEPRLIGERFPLEDDEQAALAGGGVTSDLSDLSRPENRFERDEDELLEVYARVSAPHVRPMLLEVYQRFESRATSGHEPWAGLLPALIGGLLLLQLANFGFGRLFARRARRDEAKRVALLTKALDASNRERRRIAADLHDGVVQDLTAASLAVDAAVHEVDDRVAPPGTKSVLEEATETMRASIGTLRTLLMDFYPADLAARGLAAALGDLVALARTRGLEAELDVPPDLRPPISAAGMLFRVAQEAMRNAVTHAHASKVSIHAGEDGRGYWLEVRDDGQGFDAGEPARDGHIGLRAARELMADAGGRLEVRSAADNGSVVRAELPVH
jgi:two-component system, NarL family, sensor kinase